MNIFVGNLSFETRDEELRTAFATYGAVDTAQIVMDRQSGRSRGFGFVEILLVADLVGQVILE